MAIVGVIESIIIIIKIVSSIVYEGTAIKSTPQGVPATIMAKF